MPRFCVFALLRHAYVLRALQSLEGSSPYRIQGQKSHPVQIRRQAEYFLFPGVPVMQGAPYGAYQIPCGG